MSSGFTCFKVPDFFVFIILKLLNLKTSVFKGYLHYALKTSTKAKDKENRF